MSHRLRALTRPVIALLALASSAIGIVNQFTYDDRYIVERNPAVQSLAGWWSGFASPYWPQILGGDGYRPLTILAFKLEWALGGGRPAVFHAVNIGLYVAASLLVLAVARRILPLWAAWLCAALFAVHPVHVEAVANVVGQSELIVAIAMLASTLLYLHARSQSVFTARTVFGIAALYLVACFSKEHGIVLPGLLIAAELTVVDDASPTRDRARKLAPLFAALTTIAIAFIVIRSRVLADHDITGFQPFTAFASLHLGARDRVLTAVSVVPQWARLLFWPAHLSSEYGPPELEIAQGLSALQIPGFLLLATILGVGVALRKRQPVIAFGIAIVCVTLFPSSNFLVPAGILLAERTLFLPSIGAMLIVGATAVYGAGVVKRMPRSRPRMLTFAGAAVLMAVLIAAMVRSSRRTRVWRDNDTLFRQAVIDSPRAYRAHYMLGAWAFENNRLREGETEYRKALNLFPYDPYLSYNMAEQYRNRRMWKAALPMYRWTFGLDKSFPLGRTAYAMCLLEADQYDEARSMALESLQHGGDAKIIRSLVAAADSLIAERAKQPKVAAVATTNVPGKVPESMQKAGRNSGRGGGS